MMQRCEIADWLFITQIEAVCRIFEFWCVMDDGTRPNGRSKRQIKKQAAIALVSVQWSGVGAATEIAASPSPNICSPHLNSGWM